MNTYALFCELQNADGIDKVEKSLQTFEAAHRNELNWYPVGGRENNRGTIEVSQDPGRSLIERVTNGIDAILELEYEKHNGIPVCKSPKEAANAWLNVPVQGLSELSEVQRRNLAQNIIIKILPGDGKEKRVVEIRDNGVGLNPIEMPKTILSLNEGNKIKKHYVVGLYGQGGSSTFAVAKYTLIASRYNNNKSVGFTIVRYLDLPADEYKTGHYVYLTLNGMILYCDVELEHFGSGTQVKHYGYDLSSYANPVGPNSVYGLLNSILFDPILPVWLDNRVHNYRRVIKGSRNALNGAVDIDDESRKKPELSHHVRMFYVDLGDYGRIGIEYWVLKKPEKEDKRPIAAFINPNKPFILSLNGQSHAEFSKIIIKKDADLPFLSQRIIGHIDCNALSHEAKRALFVSNREDARIGNVADLIKQEFIKALKSDDELIWLNNEARSQNLKEKDETAIQQVRNQVAAILKVQGFEITSARGGETIGGKDKGTTPPRPHPPRPPLLPIDLHEPPTYIRIIWQYDDAISFYPNQRRYIRIETDSNSTYHNPNELHKSRINIIAPNGILKICGSTPLSNGRMRAIFETEPSATIGSTGIIRVELTRPGLPILSDEHLCEIIEEPPAKSSDKKLTIPPFDFREVSPEEDFWYTLEWPDDDLKSVAFSADEDNEGVLWINYSSIFPNFDTKRKYFELRDPSLAKSFIERYRVWLAVHSLLVQRDKKMEDTIPTTDSSVDTTQFIQLIDEHDRKERCRLASIAAMIAEKEIKQQEASINI